MAVLAGSLSNLTRSFSFWDPFSDWTHVVWLYYPTTDFQIPWEVSEVADFTSGGGLGAYAYVESGGPLIGQFVQDLEVYDSGGSFVDYIESAMPTAEWVQVAFRYRASTTTLSILRNGVSQQALVIDLSTTFGVLPFGALIGGVAAGQPFGLAAAYDRMWQAYLSEVEIIAEGQSEVAVRTADLISDTPLTTAAALTDISGNGHDWTATGDISTFTGPVLPIDACEYLHGCETPARSATACLNPDAASPSTGEFPTFDECC